MGERVIGVASFDNTRLVLPVFSVSPGGADIPFDLATAAPLPPKMGSLPLARTGTPAATADACDPLPAGSLTGRAVLVRRGTCGFYQKALNAQNAGAAGGGALQQRRRPGQPHGGRRRPPSPSRW